MSAAGGGADSCSGVLWESVSRILGKELVSLGQQMGWKISNKCPQLRGIPEVKGPFPNIGQTFFSFCHLQSQVRAHQGIRVLSQQFQSSKVCTRFLVFSLSISFCFTDSEITIKSMQILASFLALLSKMA